MSRGKQGSSGTDAVSRGGVQKKSRGPGISSLNNAGMNAVQSPYAPSIQNNPGSRPNPGSKGGQNPGSKGGRASGSGSLNTNVFNIPKYG